MEGNRARWRGRASNPVGDGIRSRAGSTPAAFRHFVGAELAREDGREVAKSFAGKLRSHRFCIRI